VFDVGAFPRSFTYKLKELPEAVHGFGFLTMRKPWLPRRPPSGRPLQDRPFGGGAGYDSPNKLSWTVDDESLRAKFSDCGKVLDAKVIFDKESGRSHGFEFDNLFKC
jgi:hypothetical protein